LPQRWIGARLPMTRRCFTGHPYHPIWRHAIFSYGDTLRTRSLSRYLPELRYKSSLPAQESTVRCCGGYGRKWSIGLTSAASQRADTQSIYEVCKIHLKSFSFYRYVTCYHHLRH
jgi:hypothetical protein